MQRDRDDRAVEQWGHRAEKRGRGAELEAVLLDAAWAELMESGYARLTMEAVAARAQTGKQVLYRRWRNRAELV
ncbi:MAG TPA: helix-turn-helix domain-containing protein, partial [Kribbella sp.]|nr:helix-turn-helix domain-containing protein [Kribbella sp.]